MAAVGQSLGDGGNAFSVAADVGFKLAQLHILDERIERRRALWPEALAHLVERTDLCSNGDVRTFFDLGGGNRDTAPTVVIDLTGRVVTFAEVSLPSGTGIGMSRHLADGTPDTMDRLQAKLDCAQPGGRRKCPWSRARH